jgi:hypothetical protein
MAEQWLQTMGGPTEGLEEEGGQYLSRRLGVVGRWGWSPPLFCHVHLIMFIGCFQGVRRRQICRLIMNVCGALL